MTLFEFQDVGSVSTARAKTQLNYDVMRQNVLEEIHQPQKQPRQTHVVKTHQIVRDAKTHDLFTFQTYPYRYQARCQTST